LAALLDQATRRLTQAGIERARAEARLLAAHGLACPLEAILADPGRVLSEQQQRTLSGLIERRARREPMAHIVGRREFYSLDFRVTPDVLIPRPDSETLIEAVLAQTKDRQSALRLLDLGTGSGCLLLTLLTNLPQATGVGLDRSAAALAVARGNAAALGLAGRCQWIEGDWPAALAAGSFDIVVANPPYIASAAIAELASDVADHEPRLALDGGADGLEAYRRIAPLLASLLGDAGLVALEVGAHQAAPVGALMAYDNSLKLRIFKDLAGIDRVVLGRKNR